MPCFCFEVEIKVFKQVEKDIICSICHDPKPEIGCVQCSDAMHLSCKSQLMKRTKLCPICKADIYSQELPKNACDLAVEAGHVTCLDFAFKNGHTWNYWTYRIAAKKGHYDILKYLHDHELSDYSKWTCYYAICEQDYDLLIWLVDQGFLLNQECFIIAARRGDLEILEFLHEHQAPWDEEACVGAVEAGKLQCLQYFVANGYSWNKNRCLSLAVRIGQHKIVEFIRKC